VSWSTILFGIVGTDIPPLRAFLEVLSVNNPEYDSDAIGYNGPPRVCYHIDGEVQPEEAPRLMPSK
jgi:hypothetical protein